MVPQQASDWGQAVDFLVNSWEFMEQGSLPNQLEFRLNTSPVRGTKAWAAEGIRLSNSTNIVDGQASGLVADYGPDRHRTQLLWLALGIIGLLTIALVVLVAYGLEITTADYGEPLLLLGLLALVTCTVAYFADKERDHRAENQQLISRLHETAQALDTRVARLNRLSETSVHLAGSLDVDRISELVVTALIEQVQADAASLVLLDTTKGEYFHTRSLGPLTEGKTNSQDPAVIAATAAAEGPSIREFGRSPAITESLQAWDRIRASIAAPMRVSDVIGGALAAIREETFDTEDLNLLTTLANMCSKAIESAELHQQLRQSYYRTLHVLARSLAARDPYSAAHGEAVTWLASRLGEALALSKEDLELCLRINCSPQSRRERRERRESAGDEMGRQARRLRSQVNRMQARRPPYDWRVNLRSQLWYPNSV